jgi:outer membrane protein assembly factor BamB
MSELPLIGVIALPAIAPLIALLQLLFPGLLGDHWKQYRAVIGVLLTQSTLMSAQWIASFWVGPDATWFMTPQALAWGLPLVASMGLIASLAIRRPLGDRQQPPARIEFLALQVLLVTTALWLAWQWISNASLLDHALAINLACLAGLVHLQLRSRWFARGRRAAYATETVFLLALTAAGGAVAQLAFGGQTRNESIALSHERVPTYRFDNTRSGAIGASSMINAQPRVLASYTIPNAAGQLLLESSPIATRKALFLGARQQIQANAQGLLFGLSLQDGLPDPTRVWSYGDSSTRAIFSSPVVHDGLLYVGEGYHQHRNCRLLCIDAATGQLAWSFRTSSHVESPPTVDFNRLYFGAGDDGLYCLRLPDGRGQSPQLAWRYPSIHVDSSPLVAENKVFVGGVVGDAIANLKAVALDAATGEKIWERPADLPMPAALSYAEGRVFLGLGNGKFNAEADDPRGEVWCLDAATGTPRWKYPLPASVLASPVPVGERVYVVARSGECLALNAASGERVWQSSVGEAVASAPVVAGEQMYVVTLQGSVVCLDTNRGEEQWRLDDLRQVGANVYASPCLVDGKLYLTIGGTLHCVGEATAP